MTTASFNILGRLKLSFLGTGNMAQAFIKGLLQTKTVPGSAILATFRQSDRARETGKRFGIETTLDNLRIVDFLGDPGYTNVLVVSVKPKDLDLAAKQIAGRLEPGVIVISVVAGASLQRLAQIFRHSRLVRVMPNTPAGIGEGVSAWCAADCLSETDIRVVESVLGALGSQVRVANDNEVEIATALSGSGPAYVCAFMEALIDAGVSLGLKRSQATQLVVQTVRGTAGLVQQSELPICLLREHVTSPGGTTARALAALDKAAFRAGLAEAAEAAYRRCLEMNK